MKQNNGRNVLIVYGGMIVVVALFFVMTKDFNVFGNSGTMTGTFDSNKEIIKDSILKNPTTVPGQVAPNNNTPSSTPSQAGTITNGGGTAKDNTTGENTAPVSPTTPNVPSSKPVTEPVIVETVSGIIINDYYNGEATYNSAITKAQTALTKQGGGNLIFPAGNYRITPTVSIPSNITWIGQGVARIYSAQTSPYNILVSTESGANNITIDNIVFDQRDDAVMTPNIATWSGEFLFYSTNANNVTVKNSTFYTYGVCAILSQSYYASQTTNITILNNKAYFKRRTNTFYDVSVFNIDGRNVVVEGNYIEGQDVLAYTYWKPRTAYEIHTPNGKINNNTSKNTEIGILHLNWPSLWNTYEANYSGSISIKNNVISNAIVGIDVWGASTLPNAVTRNLTITNNNINLYLDTKYVPARGIALTDGDISNSKFENITINDNQIKMSVSTAIPDVNVRMNLLQPGDAVGAFNMNTKNTIINMNIYNNTVTNFPYSFLNLYRKNNTGESYTHDNIKVYNNTINTAAYVTTYKNVFESLYNVGYSNNVSIYSNNYSFTKKAINMLNKIEPANNFNYSQN